MLDNAANAHLGQPSKLTRRWGARDHLDGRHVPKVCPPIPCSTYDLAHEGDERKGARDTAKEQV